MSLFLFTPTTPEEVKSIIKSLDTGKATGPYSIPHQLLNALPTEQQSEYILVYRPSYRDNRKIFIVALITFDHVYLRLATF